MSRTRRAFTMVEVTVAAVIVAVALAASLATVGATGRSARDVATYYQGQMLADRLMSEILMQAYEDPEGGILFGIELSELASTRAGFDDVDDYNGWSMSPPQDKTGVKIPDTTGWTESVVVRRVDVTTVDSTRTLDTGVKRIYVVLKHEGVTVTRTALRTSAWKTLEAR